MTSLYDYIDEVIKEATDVKRATVRTHGLLKLKLTNRSLICQHKISKRYKKGRPKGAQKSGGK